MSNSNAIFAVVKAIPAGRVATYGQVAHLAGLPGAARLVGNILCKLPEATRLPWHRVVNAQGRISLPSESAGFTEQVARLAAEGVQITDGRLSLSQYQWQPLSEYPSQSLTSPTHPLPKARS
jgi:methylated-DNA-protein-cysteine methyltransferase-like protein